MKKIKNFILPLLTFILITSCSKSYESTSQANSKLSLRQINKEASIPSINLPEKSYSRVANQLCIPLSSLSPDSIYKGFGNVSTDSSIFSLKLNNTVKSSAIIRGNFLKGNQYTITITAQFERNKPEDYPSLLVSTLKKANPTNLTCSNNTNLSENDFKVITKPYKDENTKVNKTITLTFNADTCIDYLILEGSSLMSQNAAVRIKSITIKSSSLVAFEGNPEMCSGESQTISYGISGYVISESVQWRSTGDIEIIGSNFGSSVVIKNNGSNGGKIGFTNCNTGKYHEFNIRSRKSDFSISGPTRVSNQQTITFSVSDLGSDISNVVWDVKPIQYTTVIPNQSPEIIEVNFHDFYNTSNPGNAIIKATITNKCGVTVVKTHNVTLQGCKNCPIN